MATRRVSRTGAALLLLAGVMGALAALPAGASAEARWYEVRYGGAISAADRQALADLGLDDVHYAPTDRYIVFADADLAAAVADQERVTGVRALAAQEKVDPDLDGTTGLVTLQV